MATTQHYVWAAGHFVLLAAAFKCLLSFVMFRGASPWWYRTGFVGALISYGIVCLKSLGPPQPNAAYIRRAMMDENVQYLLLAFFWWSSKPITIVLAPYAIFSLFHVLTFTRTTLMSQFLPPGPPATAGGAPTPHPIAKKLQVWVKANYNKAMAAVAYTELIILIRVVLGALTFQNSLITPLVYVHFLRQRYYQSTFTRDAVAFANAKITEYVRREGTPPVLGQVWEKVQMLVGRWAGSVLAPQQPAPGAAAAR
ncbi:hypothetical protein GLOTRDRAFT_68993 [Gloeophyllum trabeum ATCC 11539]|uniref:Endoplasmic reticulum protein n=1 Tax=Gloeophyllum trabeum (strain ATCC 11539 / FP-39264 / Madison 617) TaxID=670483 RepID=S7S4T6_GLOTA|nr:uncharacterized protein GLOTRDRAFT_68993 [Gloeophyllum trabeum ATCC 11539]EPQ60939.1 hypothetical protein GLOTRDRAFT_68993 [Gloeophyllum trabeum ATCC 11539]